MTAPTNSGSISVRPVDLYVMSRQALASGQKLAAAVSAIFGALDKLSVSWHSDSASEAKAFYKALQASCDDVFGSDGKDGGKKGQGAVAAYVNFLAGAADQFDTSERVVERSWAALFFSLSGSRVPGDSAPSNDPSQTAFGYNPASATPNQ
jgi:hypothetical protein